MAVLSAALGLALGMAGTVPAVAAAGPIWSLDLHHNQTIFPPAGTAQYWLDIGNVGDAATSGTSTLTIHLPSGLTRGTIGNQVGGAGNLGVARPNWSCPGAAGDTTITCTTTDSIARHTITDFLILTVDVAPGASGLLTTTATVSGGNAPDAPPAEGCAPGIGACASEPTEVGPDLAPFGVVPGTFNADFYGADGVTPVRQSGAHPYQATFSFDLNSVPDPNQPGRKNPAGNLRDLKVDLPPGFVGNPTAVGECTPAQLTAESCPLSSQVGRVDVTTSPQTLGTNQGFSHGVYNMTHPKGILTDLAFVVANNPIHVRVSLDPQRNYAITSTLSDLNETLPPFSSKVTVWGVPADPGHDSERCVGFNGNTSTDCPTDGPDKAFLTTPFQCGVGTSMTMRNYDSWQGTGVFGPPLTYELGTFSGCDQIPFHPAVSVAPTTDAADSASGLDVGIQLPQDEDPTHIATSPLKDSTVTLPQGITVNPASANGLMACTPAEISLGTDDPVQCPNASKVATAQVITPVLPDPIDGALYLASPYDNPFNSLLAGYIVLDEPDRGILIKIPGRIDVDQSTGQLTGRFNDNPELPLSDLTLHFKAGAHSTLITPNTCGSYTTTADFAPWSGGPSAQPTDSFTIANGANGSPCPASASDQPNSPSLDAGVVSPVSKVYSAFVLHLRREDGSQRFSAFKVTLPEGLLGRLADTALCPDAALAAAQSKTGKQEQADPSCPADSHVGGVVAAVGAGPSPYYAKGDAYLSGPYKGAPVSLAVIAPAVAGPFDLGTIVIRTPLYIDPTTAQITAVSDPIPQMLQGIPTDVRSVDVAIDRPAFTLTGTSCDPAFVKGQLTSAIGAAAPLSAPYQLSDCDRLPFKPKLSLSLRGGTKRTGHPALTVVLQPRPGDANIASLSLALPSAEFLDQAHIRTVCTRVQFAADACPAGAVYGHASVETPLLGYRLQGNVYLRSSDNVLPDLVPDLRGPASQPVQIAAAGRTDTFHKGLRNTFDFIPDAPFSKLVTSLYGGKKGLLENSQDLCARTYRATAKYTAHNGDTFIAHPVLKVKCKGRSRHGHHRHHHHRHAR